MKITTLNTTDTYKLVDKEGYSDSHLTNKILMQELPQLLTGFKLGVATEDGFGLLDGESVIANDEYEFFDVITPSIEHSGENTLWDGEAPIEVGMVVKNSIGGICDVTFIEDGEVVVRQKNNGLLVLNISELKAATKSEKEQTFEKVLSAWKGQGLDFAYDSGDSEASIESVFDVVYETIMKDVMLQKDEVVKGE